MHIVFKIANKMDNIEFKDFFILNKNPTRGHKWKIDKPRATTSVRQNSFPHRVVNDWNTLSKEVVECTTINSFKNALEKAWKKILSNLNMNECIPKPILSTLPSVSDLLQLTERILCAQQCILLFKYQCRSV